MTGSVIAITGAAGGIGSRLRPLLRRPDRRLVLLDTTPIPDPAEGETAVTGSILDSATVLSCFHGADLVVHLAGIASEAPWPKLLAANIDGTQRVLEAAHRAGVPRILLASSNHAVGYHLMDTIKDVVVLPPRPDSYYGVTKVAMEALGSLFADRYGMAVVSARILWASAAPLPGRGALAWFSPADIARLVEAVLVLREPGHHIVWGGSRNAAAILNLAAGHRIGFEPADDAGRSHPDLPVETDLHQTLGGPEVFARDLGEPWPPPPLSSKT